MVYHEYYILTIYTHPSKSLKHLSYQGTSSLTLAVGNYLSGLNE